MAQVLDLGSVVGPAGSDGKSILYGTVAPTSQGVNGDLYLNISNWDMYAKESGSWVKKGNIKGATGAAGTAGTPGTNGQRGSQWFVGTGITGTSTTATVFSGSGVTSAIINDMYLNTSTSAVYRCTVAGAATVAKWVYVCNIKGLKGDTGTTGAQGPAGPVPTFSVNASGHLIATYE